MSRHDELTRKLASRIEDGSAAPGAALPSVRRLADEEHLSPATVQRAYATLARAGAVVLSPRRRARVAPRGDAAARRVLYSGGAFRLAGEDDLALSALLGEVGGAVNRTDANSNVRGLTALWTDHADGTAMRVVQRAGTVPSCRSRCWAGAVRSSSVYGRASEA